MPTDLLLPAALVTMTIALWATARLPEYLTALIFFAGATILAVAPPGVIFSGFASAAFWLILSGFVLGAAIAKVGLADRAARLLSRHLTGSWFHMVGGVVGMTYALAFIMPSNMGRIALLMPIIMAMADRAGLPPGGNGRAGLALAVGFGTFQLSASILPANVPNLVMAGAAEATYSVHLPYLFYLLLHGPVLGLLKGFLLIICIHRLFPAVPRPVADDLTPSPLSPAERRLGLLLLATLVFWMTDTLHGVSPAWVGLAAACLCLVPRIGFLSGEEFAKGVNFRTCLYIAGILGLAALVTHTGLGGLIGNGLLRLLPLDEQAKASNFASIAALVGALNFIVTANGVPAIFTPLANQLVGATGFSLIGLLMIQVIGYSTPLLPYQASPIAVAMGMAQVTARQGIKLCLAVALLSYLILLPLDYLWFTQLGLL